ncbi:MAG: hypothetical protein QNK11_04495 [Legionella sp.]|nr:hypothetical protein [Legionella sp.]
MHRLSKQSIKPRLLLASIALFFFAQTLDAAEPYAFDKRKIPLLDTALFQLDLGWANFNAINETIDIFDPAVSGTHTFNASGMRIGFNITDLKRIPSAPTWFLGGRLGAQIFSSLKNTITTEVKPGPNLANQTYSLGLPGGFWGDFVALKNFQEQKMYGLGFVGVEYDRYRFIGYRNVISGVPEQIRNSVFWTPGARAGGAFGLQLKGNFLVGLEYTHRFNQSIHAQAKAGGYPYENRRHIMHITGNSINLVFAVGLYDR